MSLKELANAVSEGHTKDALDIVAAGTAVGVVMSWLPDIAALLAIIWTAIRIGEWVYEKVQIVLNLRSTKGDPE